MDDCSSLSTMILFIAHHLFGTLETPTNNCQLQIMHFIHQQSSFSDTISYKLTVKYIHTISIVVGLVLGILVQLSIYMHILNSLFSFLTYYWFLESTQFMFSGLTISLFAWLYLFCTIFLSLGTVVSLSVILRHCVYSVSHSPHCWSCTNHLSGLIIVIILHCAQPSISPCFCFI